MIELNSKDGKKTVYQKKSMLIFTALYKIYETKKINTALLNGRKIWFNNTGWTYEDQIPEQIKEKMLTLYRKDYERMNR